MSVTVALGSESEVAELYSYPNFEGCPWTLAETVQHWLGMTLARDGLAEQGARVSVGVQKGAVVATFGTLPGAGALRPQLERYAVRLPQFLANGRAALAHVVPKVKREHRWDPSPDPAPYHPWRFFLPHGMALLNQRALLFFHYPPIRLLETNQDYLDDPVPARLEELLRANGARAADLPLFNTVMDATPIGAEDSQGSKQAGDPTWGLIPIQDFHEYQKAQVELLLNPSDHAGFTVPVVVYGAHPLATFNELYGTKLKTNQVALAELVPGKKTPVMASAHPYVFYAVAQDFATIGSGKLLHEGQATAQMVRDLVVSRWLKLMADDATQDPHAVLKHAQAYWADPARAGTVSALVRHQGSLYYSDPHTLTFEFREPLVPAAEAPPAPAPKRAAKADKPPAKPAVKPGAKAHRVAVPSTVSATTVIGDAGKPVDWWFIYKVSKESQTSGTRPVTGAEYAYFDSVTAAQKGARPVLSPNAIDHNSPLMNTLGRLFAPGALANRDLGWYMYNDEDRHQGKSGTGPGDRGHTKGVLAFDLAADSAFWLVHSVPLFPLAATDYPDTGKKMAQTLLCVQLQNADAAKDIAQLMYHAHGPNVFRASDLLELTKEQLYGYKKAELPRSDVAARLGDADPRVQLMRNLNGSMGKKPTPFSGRVPFVSKGGQKFLAIAKNKAWGNPALDPAGAKDFYNDLVSPVLGEDIEVETWENAGKKIPAELEHGEVHKVENMQSVDLNPIGIPYKWSEKVDHAKLAISARDNGPGAPKWVCVGDINFTNAQEKRGGGTVAFQCEALWSSLVQVLQETPLAAKKPAKAK